MAKIHGFVKNAIDNKPIAFVSLKFVHKDDQTIFDEVETNELGEFETNTLKAGNYTWEASIEGFIIKRGETLNVPAGRNRHENEEIRLEPIVNTGSISGKVTDQAGVGIQGAQVTATPAGGAAVPAVPTDANGNYRIQNLAPGNYTVSVQAPVGYQNPQPKPNVQVQAGQDTANNDFQLAAQPAAQTGTISGKVTDQAGVGIQGAQVTATPAGGAAVPAVPTDANGNYRIQNLAPGNYTVSVQAPVGYQNPQPKPNVQVQAGRDTANNDFQLAAQPAAQTGTISGKVTDQAGVGVAGVQVKATDTENHVTVQTATIQDGSYIIANLSKGMYTIRVEAQNYFAAQNVQVTPGKDTKEINFSLDVVADFIDRLDDARFNIESPISLSEAKFAVDHFFIVNTVLAGLVEANGNIDIFGLKNLPNAARSLGINDGKESWRKILDDADPLKDSLQDLISHDEVKNIKDEAKRQFNLGINNNVTGNVQFPTLFMRYVEIGLDPLLSIDIAKEDVPNSFLDKTKIAQADDLLKELKGLILQIVRSLSRYGMSKTKKQNEKWAPFITQSLELLTAVGQERDTGDEDDMNYLAALSILTNKNRERDIVPYVVLARNGGKLLDYAVKIYTEFQNSLEDFDKGHLRGIFQPQGKEFWTTRIRREAAVIKRYPLSTWG